MGKTQVCSDESNQFSKLDESILNAVVKYAEGRCRRDFHNTYIKIPMTDAGYSNFNKFDDDVINWIKQHEIEIGDKRFIHTENNIMIIVLLTAQKIAKRACERYPQYFSAEAIEFYKELKPAISTIDQSSKSGRLTHITSQSKQKTASNVKILGKKRRNKPHHKHLAKRQKTACTDCNKDKSNGSNTLYSYGSSVTMASTLLQQAEQELTLSNLDRNINNSTGSTQSHPSTFISYTTYHSTNPYPPTFIPQTYYPTDTAQFNTPTQYNNGNTEPKLVPMFSEPWCKDVNATNSTSTQTSNETENHPASGITRQ